jgi:acetyl-CoA carboxylase beta subunit
MTVNPVEVLALTPENCPGNQSYQDAYSCVRVQDDSNAFLFFASAHAAGAIGKVQGESLLKAIESLYAHPVRTLQIHINSAGANFYEPMEGLFYLNALLEALWQLRASGTHIRVISSGWLFGGMALALASVATEIILGKSVCMGLLGKRVSGNAHETPIPVASFQPASFKLVRTSN